MINLARGFIERGMEVDLVVSSDEGDYRHEVPAQVRLVSLGVRRVAAVLPHLARHIRRRKPQFVMSRMYRSNLVALAAARLSGHRCSSFVIVDNTTSIEMAAVSANLRNTIKNHLDVALMRRLYPDATGIVCVSHGAADDLAKLCRIARQNIDVIYNPIEFDKIQAMAAQCVDHPWIVDEVSLVVAAGRLSAQKDYPTLLKAMAHVKERGRLVRLLILGQGEHQRRLEELISQFELSDRVALLGFIPNPFPYMKRADLFVLSSAWEGLGNVLIEAMALGTPVVSTNCPFGPSEIMRDGEFGHLVTVGDHRGLGEAIIETLDAPPDAERLIERAQSFDAPRILEQYVALLERMSHA
ncbi:MAG: glycosyltransferase [Bradymonadaceae bacterium]|nr:glycosyltransferase [Lujinxingiaceae bacterium]